MGDLVATDSKLKRSSEPAWLVPVVIFTLAVLLRSAVAVHLPARVLWPDGARYMQVADNLLERGTFGSLRDNMLSVPLQPLLIAIPRLIFGTNFTAIRLFFAILGSTSCIAGYLLAKRLFGPTAALLTGLLLAFYPHYVYLSALFEYPQTPFILLIAFVFLTLFAHFRSGSILSLAICGALLSLAMLAVPVAELLFPVLLVCILMVRRPANWAAIAAFCLAFAVPVGSWALRNELAYGDPILVNRAGGFSFWTANNETYYEYGKQAVVPPCEVNSDREFCRQWLQVRRTLHEQDDLTEGQRVALEDKAAWENGKKFFFGSLQRTLRLTGRKFLQFWSPVAEVVSNRSEYATDRVSLISIASFVPVLLLGVAGLALSAWKWRTLLPVYGYFALLTATYSVFLPTTRYRYPLDFFLILFAAYALTRWIPLLRHMSVQEHGAADA